MHKQLPFNRVFVKENFSQVEILVAGESPKVFHILKQEDFQKAIVNPVFAKGQEH